MAERPWTKDWRDSWRDERLDDLSCAAVNLRPCLNAMVVDVDHATGTGWVQNRDGRPLSVAQLARLIRHSEDATLAGLRELEAVGMVERRGDGCWGVVGWLATQETPEAARVRRFRAKPVQAAADVTPAATTASVPVVTRPVTVTPRGGEDRGQRTDLTHPPPAGVREDFPVGSRIRRARESLVSYSAATIAQRSAIPRSLYAQIEADEVLPTREQLGRLAEALGDPAIAALPLPERDEDLVAQVVAQYRDFAVELGVLDPDIPRPPTVHDIEAVYAAGPEAAAAGLPIIEVWRRVLVRAAEQLRRELARGRWRGRDFFRLELLAKPERRRELLGAVDLDQRRQVEAGGARASPRRGPAPPQHPDALPTTEIPE